MEICGGPFVFHDRHVARAQRSNSLFEHLLVKLVTNFLDVTRLFLAKQIARTTNIQIMAGQLEPGP